MDLIEDDLPMIVIDFFDRILVLRILVELQERDRIEVVLRVENADAAAEPHHRCRPASRWVPDGPVRPAEGVRRIARNRSLLHEQFAYRHHFPFDLLAFGALIVELPDLRIRVDLVDLELAPLHPALPEFACVSLPVEFQRRYDPRGLAIEARRNVLLA